MKAITVTKEEATTIVEKDTPGAIFDPETGKYLLLNAGYEKWAYVYKKILPDTLEEAKAKKLVAIRMSANQNLADNTVPTDPWWRQRNAALGLCESAEATAIVDWIAATRVESNRCEALVDAATTLEEINAVEPIWPVEG